jgi:serine/threonine protein phosphatase PrpC
MGTAVKWRSGAATDTGMLRDVNEDRYWVDDDQGVFLVVDGLGGHAAGEKAAETAVEVIREQLARSAGPPADRVRSAVALANNAIHRMSQEREEWRGMACVLTLALAGGDSITIGHVGDSRLYLVWNGTMRKLTADHSPVGEQEDRGELTEEEAMQHPRRNEVYRDLGTTLHAPGDEDFVDVRHCRFKPDAAILLCSDGLSDCLTTAAMSAIVERYDGDPDRVARELVAAANEAGGKDNVTAVFVAGEEFLGSASQKMAEARARHAATRAREENAAPRPGRFAGRTACLAYGFAIGAAVTALAFLAARWGASW